MFAARAAYSGRGAQSTVSLLRDYHGRERPASFPDDEQTLGKSQSAAAFRRHEPDRSLALRAGRLPNHPASFSNVSCQTDETDDTMHEVAAHLRRELFRAQKVAREAIDQREVQSMSIEGHATALRIASDEATHSGAVWKPEEVHRFKCYEPAAFGTDAVRELVDQALVGHARRLREALGEAAKARRRSLVSEEEGTAWLNEVLRTFNDPNATRLRQLARQSVSRANRAASDLRAALERLEEETAAAQQTHAADARSMATRLAAHRDAAVATTLIELQRAEQSTRAGEISISSLQAELRCVRSEAKVAAERSEAQYRTMVRALFDTQKTLEAEREAREDESAWLVEEVARLRAALGSNEAVRQAERTALGLEVLAEEARRASDGQAHRRRVAELHTKSFQEKVALEAALSTRLRKNGFVTPEDGRHQVLPSQPTLLPCLATFPTPHCTDSCHSPPRSASD